MERREPEQLNNKDTSEEFVLEDILREFSDQPKDTGKPKEAPKEQVCRDTMVFKPIRSAPAPTGDDAPVKVFSGKKPVPVVRNAVKIDDEPEETPTLLEEEPPEPEAPVKPLIGLVPDSPVEPLSPQKSLADAQKGTVWRLWRMMLLLLAAFCEALLLPELWPQQLLPALKPYIPYLHFGLLGLSLLLSGDVLWYGLRDLIHLSISPFTLSLPISVLAVFHTVQTFSDCEVSYCGVVILLLFFLLRTLHAQKRGQFHALRTVCGFSAPMGIFDARQLLKDTDSLRREPADIDLFLRDLSAADSPKRILSFYCTLLLPVSAAAAKLLAQRTVADFIPIWLILLLAATPFAGALCYPRIFRALSRQLAKAGGALSGWKSAKLFGGRHTIILRDEDLFPRSSITGNGMKILGSFSAPRVIAYAREALEIADSPLVELFASLQQAQHAPRYPLTEHRIYDGGGIGAEIMGDVVLVGSLSFMHSMGVHMSTGARVRQAVYVSVNGELAGIFAIKYKANASTRTGLRDVLANRNFSVVIATRDFIITPELIAAKYELPTDSMRFPPYSERLRLSESSSDKKEEQGGLIAKDTFGAFASTVAAGRKLRITSYLSLFICLLAGIAGFLLCAFLLLLDAPSVVSAFHLATFQLLWAAAVGFITLLSVHF